MKKFTSLLGGVLIAMFFVAFNTGCAQKSVANTLGPSDPVLNPTEVPTTGVTPGVTPVVTPGTTHTYYMTFTAPASTSFEAWTGKFPGAPYTVTRVTYIVPAGGTWTSTSTVVDPGAGETSYDELLCVSSSGTVTVYKDGLIRNQYISLPANTVYGYVD